MYSRLQAHLDLTKELSLTNNDIEETTFMNNILLVMSINKPWKQYPKSDPLSFCLGATLFHQIVSQRSEFNTTFYMMVCDLIAGCVVRHNHLYPEDYAYASADTFTEEDMHIASYNILLLLNGRCLTPCYISYLSLFKTLEPLITDAVNLECEKLLILLAIHPQSYNYSTDIITISAVFYILTLRGCHSDTLLDGDYRYYAKHNLSNQIHTWITDLESMKDIDTDY